MFHLTYLNLHIANLSFINGEWIFEYTEDFKNQDKVLPLWDFPMDGRQFRSRELFPYFKLRYPGRGQLVVQGLNSNLSDYNKLKLFGRYSIHDRYQLIHKIF